MPGAFVKRQATQHRSTARRLALARFSHAAHAITPEQPFRVARAHRSVPQDSVCPLPLSAIGKSMDEQPRYRPRWNRAFEPRPVNRRTSGFWRILPASPTEVESRFAAAEAVLGPYETRYDVDHGYCTDRTIVDPAAM